MFVGEELAVIRRLDEQARRVERDASGHSAGALIVEHRMTSHCYGGRSVFGIEPTPTRAAALAESLRRIRRTGAVHNPASPTQGSVLLVL